MQYLFLFALVCGLAFAQENAFIVPPPSIPGYDLQHAPVYVEGSIEELRWETTYKMLTMYLCQFGRVHGCDGILGSCAQIDGESFFLLGGFAA